MQTKIKDNVKKAIKDLKKERKNLDIKAMHYFWNMFSWELDKNDIRVSFNEVQTEDSGYTFASYWIPQLSMSIILDWDVDSFYNDENELISEIERLEKQGRALEKNITLKK